MRNQLKKRLPRELKQEASKYFVLFVFITIMVGFISGFEVASQSMMVDYNESFEKYNIEDGNFETYFTKSDELTETLQKEGITLFDNYYKEETAEKFIEQSDIAKEKDSESVKNEKEDSESTLRIFIQREEVNKGSLLKGEFPFKKDEIAIDRMYADNNHIVVGDDIIVGDKKLKVTGLIALSDYSALYQNPADMMFDSILFGVAVMTEDGFETYSDDHIHYSYSWKYDKTPKDKIEAKEKSEDLLDILKEQTQLKNFIPQFSNQAIQFAGDDIGKDKYLMLGFFYIVMIIISFIFAITTGNTIVKEANVIGTLRASGYKKSELIIHYMTMPMIITVFSSVVGNVIGYTIFKDIAAQMYYGSYSLPTYETLWNAEAFIMTTIVPIIFMFLINLVLLVHKLKLSPLRFIRRDLTQKKNKKSLNLNKRMKFMKRFRIKIILQNIPNYVTIIIGIFLANIILLFGIALPHVLDYNQESIIDHMASKFQYVLKVPVESKTEKAEKYCVTTLSTIEGRLKSEEVLTYGIKPDSRYFDMNLEKDEVAVSSAFAEKFELSVGEHITLKEEYGNKAYCFKITEIYEYPSSIALFLNQTDFNKTFAKEETYFNGYFSDVEITDIEDVYILSTVTKDDMLKTCRQLRVSMGEMMDLFLIFGIVMFMLIIYLLSKIIIEKNAQSISMTKILGYTNGEISKLYIACTSMVVILSLLITLPIVNILMKKLLISLLSTYSGWFTYYVPLKSFMEIIGIGIISYAAIAFFQFRKVKKIPLDDALKNVE